MPLLSEELRDQIRARREPRVLYEGQLVPGSVPLFRDALATAVDEFERDQVLGEICLEYIQAGMDDEHLLVQRERVANLPEEAVRWIGLGMTLSHREGGAEEAKKALEKAVELSRGLGTLLRYSLTCQARVARSFGDSILFARVIAELLEYARTSPKEDCGLFPELVENLPAGFCSPSLVEAYRELSQ
jgi:hypothetical protein